MSELPITESDLQAYVDGKLAAGRRAELEAWLESRPEDAERVAAYRRINEELRASFDPVLDEPIPERLRAAPRRRQRLRAVAAALGWIAIGAVAGGAGGWTLHGAQRAQGLALEAQSRAQPQPPDFVRRAAIAHAVYSPEVRHPVEVGADQEAHLVAWLSKRLGAKVRAPQLGGEGFALVGGRLLPGDTGPVAYFMYQSPARHRITLYVRTETPPQGLTAFRYVREGNVRVFYWLDRNFGYALSSTDVSKPELLRVATLVYQQLSP